MLIKEFKPKHDENRMSHEGDVVRARKSFYKNRNNNLAFLLKNRFTWMNDYIRPNHVGMEIGCGTGVSKEYILSNNYILTDYAEHDWLDVKNVDALNTSFDDNSFDFVVSSNMIHHVPYPICFLEEMSRILKPNGYILIQEINASFCARLILRLMRHEGYSYKVDIFNRYSFCTDPDDPWSANCAIPNLLFDDKKMFHRKIPYFEICSTGFSEFFTFLNSGGVIAKTFYIPLPRHLLVVLKKIDDLLTDGLPSIFALQRQVVLKNRKPV